MFFIACSGHFREQKKSIILAKPPKKVCQKVNSYLKLSDISPVLSFFGWFQHGFHHDQRRSSTPRGVDLAGLRLISGALGDLLPVRLRLRRLSTGSARLNPTFFCRRFMGVQGLGLEPGLWTVQYIQDQMDAWKRHVADEFCQKKWGTCS